MAQYIVYIKVPDYLGEWLKHDHWDAEHGGVQLPRGSGPRAVLTSVLRKAPAGYLPPSDKTGLVPIAVPTIKGINPDSANYLPHTGEKAVVAACKIWFKSLMYVELGPLFAYDIPITQIVEDFMDRHGIPDDPKNWEAIRQQYYRMREKTNKNGSVKKR